MSIKKSAHPVATATSGGPGLSVAAASGSGQSGSSLSAPASVGAKADLELARNHEQPTQSRDNSRCEAVVSNVVPMKSVAQRKQHAYLMPYPRLCELLGFGPDEQPVVLDLERLQQATRMLLRGVHVDEDWYLRQYPDVRDAVVRGVFRSAKHHFVESGYFEGRKPARVLVDEEWYGRAYPDVGESVEFGELGSCQEHFDRYGESEGRLPAED